MDVANATELAEDTITDSPKLQNPSTPPEFQAAGLPGGPASYATLTDQKPQTQKTRKHENLDLAPKYYSNAELADVQKFLDAGDALLAQGDARAAIAMYERGQAKYPESARLRLATARAYIRLHEMAQARLACVTGIQTAVNQSDADAIREFMQSIPQ
jgi:hypothetical protein